MSWGQHNMKGETMSNDLCQIQEATGIFHPDSPHKCDNLPSDFSLDQDKIKKAISDRDAVNALMGFGEPAIKKLRRMDHKVNRIMTPLRHSRHGGVAICKYDTQIINRESGEIVAVYPGALTLQDAWKLYRMGARS